VGSWLYQVVAGIEIGAPGYKQILIQPMPGGGLVSARATYQSLYGQIESSWRIEAGTFTLRVTIPPNTTATVHLPQAAGADVTESDQALDTRQAGADAIVEIGSGHYTFGYAWLG